MAVCTSEVTRDCGHASVARKREQPRTSPATNTEVPRTEQDVPATATLGLPVAFNIFRSERGAVILWEIRVTGPDGRRGASSRGKALPGSPRGAQPAAAAHRSPSEDSA